MAARAGGYRLGALPRHALDGNALVAGHAAIQGVLVGNALGQQPLLWRFLPHLPFEWLGIAASIAAWRIASTAPVRAGQLLPFLVVTVAALTAAAGLETWAVPL